MQSLLCLGSAVQLDLQPVLGACLAHFASGQHLPKLHTQLAKRQAYACKTHRTAESQAQQDLQVGTDLAVLVHDTWAQHAT